MIHEGKWRINYDSLLKISSGLTQQHFNVNIAKVIAGKKRVSFDFLPFLGYKIYIENMGL